MSSPSRSVAMGLSALAAVGCWILALILANAGANGGGPSLNAGAAVGQPTALNRVQQLTALHTGATDQVLAVVCRCLGLALVAVVAAQLCGLVRKQRPEASRRWLLGSGFAGAMLIAAATVFGYFALAHVADVFVTGAPHTAHRAQALIDASTALHVSAVLDLVSRIVLALWIASMSLEMLRASLFDTTLAYWGFGACAALVVLPIGDAMFIGWMASVGFLALGYWPGGRPEAWTRAIPTGT